MRAKTTLRRLLPDLGRRTLVMGILNVTPDSFSDGGAYRDPDQAVTRALRMLDDGADLIDVGGESTRPGADPVGVEEELARVLPVVRALRLRGVGPLSIDTTKAEVAKAALAAGVSMVNDISGMTFDSAMPSVVAESRAPVVLMHTRGRPSAMQEGTLEYPGGVASAVFEALGALVARAEAAGIERDAILVDPGLGFGKTPEQNLVILRALHRLRSLGCPILVGPSRKSFLGVITGRSVTERDFATAAAVALAVARGADVVRVHEVRLAVDVVAVADAVERTPSRERGALGRASDEAEEED